MILPVYVPQTTGWRVPELDSISVLILSCVYSCSSSRSVSFVPEHISLNSKPLDLITQPRIDNDTYDPRPLCQDEMQMLLLYCVDQPNPCQLLIISHQKTSVLCNSPIKSFLQSFTFSSTTTSHTPFSTLFLSCQTKFITNISRT